MKKFIFFCFVFLFCFNFSTVSYCSDSYDTNFPDFKNLITDSSGNTKYYNLVVLDSKYISWIADTTYSLYVYDSLTDIPYATGQRNGLGYCFDTTASNVLGRNISWKKYDYTIGSANEWVLDNSTQQLAIFGGGEGCIYNTNGVYNLYSNFDITDSTGRITFFQHAPTISGALVPMKSQTLSLILDCLHYLIPCLIVLVICSIGFRKAWSWLKLQLSI